MRQTLFLAAVALLVLFIIAIGAGPRPVYSQLGTAPANRVFLAVARNQKPALAGQVIEFRGWLHNTPLRLQVTARDDVRTLTGGGITWTPANGQFVIVLGDVTNLGNQTDGIGIYPPTLRLRDAANRTFGMAPWAYQLTARGNYGGRITVYEDIAAGQKRPVVLAFDVTTGAADLYLSAE